MGASVRAMESSSSVRIVCEGDGYVVAVWRNVVIQCWLKATPTAALQATLAEFRSLRTRELKDRKLLSLAVIAEGTPPPDSEGRAVGAGFPQYFDYFTAIVEGTGLRVSVIRGVLTGMAMMARMRAKWEIVATVAESAAALAKQPGAEFSADELVAVIAKLRASH